MAVIPHYGFNLGQIEGLDSSVETVTLTIANATESNTYTLNKVKEDPLIWADGADSQTSSVSMKLLTDGIAGLNVVAFTESDVGEVYNITLSTESIEPNFKSAVELVLPSSIFDVTQTLDFSNLETTVTIGDTSFTKTSNVALTAEQLDGAIFKMGNGEIPITSDMLQDMSEVGVTGTLINLPSPYGPVVFLCTEAGSVVSEPGCYTVTQMMSYVNSVTLSYQETYEATVKAIAIGTAELTDNASSLPDGVIYLQIEG